MNQAVDFIHDKTGISSKGILAVLKLFSEGATVPFIARYRKDVTGNLLDDEIHQIKDFVSKFDALEKRKAYILETMQEKNATEKELQAIVSSWDEAFIEQIFAPYRQTKKSKLIVATEIEGDHLLKVILSKSSTEVVALLQNLERKYKVSSADLLSAAGDVMAHWWAIDDGLANRIENTFWNSNCFKISEKEIPEEERAKYKQFVSAEIIPAKTPSHRFLAIARGADLGFLSIRFVANWKDVANVIERKHQRGAESYKSQIFDLAWKSYKPKLKNQLLKRLKTLSDEQATKVFASNLYQLLMASPVGNKRVLAIDPGFKSGCKLVVLDAFGSIKGNDTIFPHPPQNKRGPAQAKIAQLVNAHKIEVIAVGNGTAGQQTLQLIKSIKGLPENLQVYEVNEDGASVYSASSLARKELPEYDVTVRGAASIGRRLQDPLSELVKINPMSLGVGQYQHDVDQKMLQNELDFVVEKVVNKVGVDINSASPYILKYIAGIGESLAETIVDCRNKNGRFNSRKELLEVPKLGNKAFEQSAGFLRVFGGTQRLDETGVHPEHYPVVQKMCKALNVQLEDLMENEGLIAQLKTKGAEVFGIGEQTFEDILTSLAEPKRDPRSVIKKFEFDPSLETIKDVKEGVLVPGIVTNVTEFGAFVNIGIKENGLIHKSNIANEFVQSPLDYIQVNDYVKAKVIQVDVEKKRIGLSVKDGGIILKS
jgi:uncharacterized protein